MLLISFNLNSLGPNIYNTVARDIVNIEKDLARVSIVNQSVMETLERILYPSLIVLLCLNYN